VSFEVLIIGSEDVRLVDFAERSRVEWYWIRIIMEKVRKRFLEDLNEAFVMA